MRVFKGTVRTDVDGSDCDFEFEVSDEATEKEIEEEARQAAFNYVEWFYKKIQ